MLATLTHRRFSDPKWLFELKFDGERCLAFRNGSSVRLFSRNQKLLNNTYPEIGDAIAAQALDNFVVDGEIVAFDGAVTSFSRLQRRMQITDPIAARMTGVEVFYYVFDAPYLTGYDTTALGLVHRKAALERALSFEDPRTLVIWAMTNSPASGRPSQAGRRRGGFAPATPARYGSHSATGAGSLSTTL